MCTSRYWYPLSVYGRGGQTRGFLSLVDSLQCLTIACENPPDKGQYRVFNQLESIYDVTSLANSVQKAAAKKGIEALVQKIPNPRKEAEEHYYKVDAYHLPNLGFKPTRTLDQELDLMLEDLTHFRDRIKQKESHIAPKTSWIGNTVGLEVKHQL